MTGIIKKQLILPLLILFIGLFFTTKANAASLANVSDTITTSRPSASAPLNADQAASATQISLVDNGSIYLSSDSAVLQFDTGQTQNIVNVASMSAQIAGTPNTRNVYFTSAITNTHHKGTAVFVPITATHTIKFTTNNIPASGHIIITFPGSGNTTASPSATTFAFNGLTTGNASTYIQLNNVACTSITVTAPTINCLVTSAITTPTEVSVIIGCSAQSGGTCTAFSPLFINPTKSATAGTADTWKINIKTQDASSIDLDSAKAVIGTVDAVQVQGTVDAFLTFTIAGLNNGTNITTQNASCTGGDITNPGTGLDATATFVNLGALVNSAINISAQELTVSTNGAAGYSITATSSGRFINPASGFYLPDNVVNGGNNGLTANDTPAPTVFPVSGTAFFGIHPCGADVASGTWANAATGFNSGAKYSNPWNVGTSGFYATIASYTAPSSSRKTEIEYAATAAVTTPAGIYSNYFTYVATPIF